MARSKIDPKIKERGLSFAKRLKEERINKDMTQSELSARAKIPLDTLRSIENGRTLSPGVFIAADLVHALDSELDSWTGLSPAKTSRAKRGGV